MRGSETLPLFYMLIEPLLCSHFCHFADLRTQGVLYFKHYKIKEYKVFFFSAILIFENSPYILELQIMPI